MKCIGHALGNLFIPTKVGTYPMYCDKKAPFSKSHREKGMKGLIEVVE